MRRSSCIQGSLRILRGDLQELLTVRGLHRHVTKHMDIDNPEELLKEELVHVYSHCKLFQLKLHLECLRLNFYFLCNIGVGKTGSTDLLPEPFMCFAVIARAAKWEISSHKICVGFGAA